MGAKLNEAPILKATSVKLGDGLISILLYVHHTPLKENKGTDKSWYRYEGLVAKEDDLKAMVQDLASDAKRTLPWKWPTKEPTWNPDWYMSYDGHEDNARFAAWLNLRIKKALDFPAYLDLIKNGNSKLASGKIKHSDAATYDCDEPYERDDGQTVDVTDIESLKKAAGHTFCHRCVLKRSLPKTPSVA